MLCGSVQQLVVQKLHSKLLEGLLDALGCRLYDYLFTKEKGGQATAIPNRVLSWTTQGPPLWRVRKFAHAITVYFHPRTGY
jgi:hypothetical protein